MRKVVVFAAVAVAAAFSIKPDIAVGQMENPNPNTMKLMSDAMHPYEATSKPAAAAPKEMARHSKKKMKKS